MKRRRGAVASSGQRGRRQEPGNGEPQGCRSGERRSAEAEPGREAAGRTHPAPPPASHLCFRQQGGWVVAAVAAVCWQVSSLAQGSPDLQHPLISGV